VDQALLGAYLAGANTRRIRKALAPLLGEKYLSKSAISRLVGRRKALFEEWRQRDLSGERYPYLFLDGFFLPVRLAKRVVRVPVQAVLGVDEEGRKVLLSLEIAASESLASWKAVVGSLQARGLPAPELVVLDGNPGLCRAVREAWPGVAIQRCTKHKLENLLARAPKHAWPDVGGTGEGSGMQGVWPPPSEPTRPFCGSGGSWRRGSPGASRKGERSCSPSFASRGASGCLCARRTCWSG
jgi:transposase-like protein